MTTAVPQTDLVKDPDRAPDMPSDGDPGRPKLRLALIVQGRFHFFDLGRALLARGHDVRILTNYPKWAAARFSLPESCLDSNPVHGIAVRIAQRIQRLFPRLDFDPLLHRWFGSWAARKIARGRFDLYHCFTQVAEEILGTPCGAVSTLMRGSAHIQTQYDILSAEKLRSGKDVEAPRPWTIAREKREYELADHIFVLSSFAYRSFVEHGIRPEKLSVLPLGVNTVAFRPGPEQLAARRERILSRARLRVLMVGSFSCQKGALDLVETIRLLDGEPFDFRFVGSIAQDAADLAAKAAGRLEFVPRRPQSELPREYEWGDVFVFPTLQDGFAIVLAQAQGACLPILTTTNCSGPDLVSDGVTGWVLPIRSPESFAERLRWCHANREALAGMADYIASVHRQRDWDDVAAGFEDIAYSLLHARAASA